MVPEDTEAERSTTSRASHLPRSLEVRKRVTRVGGGEGAERVKFEYVFGGVMPSPAGVNASLSKDLDHVGEAEICCIRRGRSQCRRGDVCGRGLRQCSTNPATRHWWCEADDQFFASTD